MKLTIGTSDLDRLLQSMYRLPDRPVLHLQDEGSCKQFVNLLVECLEGMQQEESLKAFSSDEVDVIKRAIPMVGESSPFDVRWFPRYGSAIVVHQSELQPSGLMTITIVGLDRHSFFLHEDGKGGYSHESDALDYRILVAGTTNEAKVEAFWKRFQQLLATSQQCTGDRRTAAGGRQGHQFTPTLIHAVSTQAIKCPCDESKKCTCRNIEPKGGFTDVGRHTGGEPRNTSFPLAKSLLEWCMVQCGSVDKLVFRKAMLCVHLRILEDRVLRGEEDSKCAQGERAWKVRADLDVAFRILQLVTMEGTQLHESGTSIKFVYDRAKRFRLRMDKVVKHLAESEANRFIVPNVDDLVEKSDSFRSPRISLQEEKPRTAPTNQDYGDRIKQNIGPTNLMNRSDFDMAKLLEWLEAPHFQGKTDHLTVVLRLRTVENAFWSQALRGFEKSILDARGMECLLAVVNEYRSVFHNFETGHLDRGCLMLTDLRSRELLVVWIAYCLAFASAKQTYYDPMSTVGVALHYTDLEHLVLSDKKSWDVAKAVATFLRRNNYSHQTELFSFRFPDATFNFAERLARKDSSLQSVWNAEKKDAEFRVDKHWESVIRKKKGAERLRSKISELCQELARAESDCASARSSYDSLRLTSQYASRAELIDCEAKVGLLKSNISYHNSNLLRELEAPTPVCQPLPRKETLALRWIFFLHMPVKLRVLSTLTFTGQQMLVPRPWKAKVDGPDGDVLVDVFASLHVTNGECLTAFYNCHQRCEFHTPQEVRKGVSGDVAFTSPRPVDEVLPKRIGPRSVDEMSSREDGVWYPDSLPFGMEWAGGSMHWDTHAGKAFNPFGVPRKWVVSYFTEQLPAEASSLQWAMRLDENDGDAASRRGNRPLACQESRPHWLSKTQFLTFCRLRGFPCKQLRDIASALAQRSLPFQLECVHSLFKQTMFHIGRLDGDGQCEIRIGWKRDLYSGDWRATIKPILEDISDELVDSPSSYQSALLVCDIAGFLSDWNKELKEISRRLAIQAFSWASDFGRQAESAEKNEDSISFRVQQRLLLSISILCLAQGPMLSSDCRLVTEYRAISRNACVDEEEASEARKKVDEIERRADSIIAGRIDEIVRYIKRNPSFLTDAVRAVIAVVPGDLSWQQWESSSSSFVATGKDGCVYAINILSGAILVNGLPPSSLPSEILEHKLFKRSFGDRNFEVVSKNEVYETVRRVKGYLYCFTLESDRSLRTVETSPDGEKLELLDGTEGVIEKWAPDLPIRLQRMYSHWFSRKEKRIILRGTRFFDRSVYFIIHLAPDENGLVGNCHEIPRHLQRGDLREYAERSRSFPQLVLHDPDLLAFFEKLEHRDFIHYYLVAGDDSSSKRQLSIMLPRYGLTFNYDGGEFHCAEISGFVLAEYQQLEGSLFGFERYLVIQRGADKKAGHSARSILVGDGEIVRKALGGSTVTKTSKTCDSAVHWHKYDVHARFQTLSASTVSSRLLLAALHSSSSFLSPDCDSLRTGLERAMELVRESWVARPLTHDEDTCLSKVQAACRGRHSPLSLLCTEVLQSSKAVPFLHGYTERDSMARRDFDDCSVASEKYMNDLESGLLNRICRLTPNEESRILGQRGRLPVYQKETPNDTRDSATVPKDSGKLMEGEVLQLLSPRRSSRTPNQDFPLDFDSHATRPTLEGDIIAELLASWTMHQNELMLPELLCVSNLSAEIKSLKDRTLDLRQKLEEYVLAVLNNVGAESKPSGLDLRRLSDIQRGATPRDLMAAILRDQMFQELYPSIPESAMQHLKVHIVEWLRLCVVEDKLLRLMSMICNDEKKRELAVVRNWDPSENLAWLVFEVEHCLQIWPEQAIVAKHLIRNSGDIVQLNMGMGKTRVIIPLLILHWRFHCIEDIPRINILPSLLSEACEFFHQRLTASIFNLRMIQLPFSRDVELDNQKVAAMTSLLNFCSTNGGFVVVAPEHRLSLGLKIVELELWSTQGRTLAEELRAIEDLPWVDILDESDELLHHRRQLIYAVGAVQELPAGPSRWHTAEALLAVLHGNPEVGEWIERHPQFIVQSEETASESFRSLQVTSQGSMASLVPDLYKMLARAVLSDPPHELEWVQDHSMRNDILASLISENAPPKRIGDLGDDHRNDVLALRGLLVGGILVHCLQKRHRVDFGVARPGKKKLSIPFRGADTPSMRSEFSHPDCAIVFTLLAYYDDGLSKEEVIIAFETLFTLGRNVQRTVYSQWYELSTESIEKEDRALCCRLDSVEKIDLANRAQLCLLVKFFGRNIRVINFWLNACVFPNDMQYYPQRLSATSWNLAKSAAHIVGFSGTNDNHRLLPGQMKQHFPDVTSSDPAWETMVATNGRMLDVILNRTTECLPLVGSNKVDSILELLQENPNLQQAQAIIDAGALLAGHSNETIARKLMKAFTRSNAVQNGIMFFDNSASVGRWMALEPSGRLLPLSQSPVQESQAFAIFDEPRCRGSDLKLNKRAAAMLTIGPRMCKDKLMQAAGRLRALGQGQSLVIVGTEFLFNEIRESARCSKEFTPRVILEWTVQNTCRANMEGMFPWCDQGFLFCTSQSNQKLSVEKERLSLDDFYGRAFHAESVSSAMEKARAHHIGRVGDEASIIGQDEQALMDSIVDQVKRYGALTVQGNCGMEEECERELELEREMEKEKEVEVPYMTALKETDWNKSTVLEANSPDCVSHVIEVKSIRDFVATRLQPCELSRFEWSGDVYGTSNFFKTVAFPSGMPLESFNHFLRPVDTFLAFSNNQVLLVSEREADELIALFWKQARNTKANVSLAHLSVLTSAMNGKVRGLHSNSLVLGRKWSTSRLCLRRRLSPQSDGLTDATVATMQLFDGETVYPTDSRREALKKILRGPDVAMGPAVADPSHIVDARGNSHMFQYSDLEKACRELAREEQQLIQAEEDETSFQSSHSTTSSE